MLDRLSGKLNYARIRLNCKLTLIQPQEVLEGREDLNVRVPLISTHWETASLFDHMFLGALASELDPKLCFEIGTSLGLVTSTLAVNSPPQAKIHTLDLSRDERIGSFFRGKPESEKIQQHFGPSTQFDFRPFKNRVDLMFIDGSHERADVITDSRNGFAMLSDQGVLLWHDVTPHFPGVVDGLESLAEHDQIFRIYGTGLALYAKPGAPLQARARQAPVASDDLRIRSNGFARWSSPTLV